MGNSRRDLGIELLRRLTTGEYAMAKTYLDDAIYWCERDNDERVRNCLICAFELYKSKGELHCAYVIKEYLSFF